MSAVLAVPGVGGHAAVLRAVARKAGRMWWLALVVLGVTGLATMSDAPGMAAAAFATMTSIALQLVWWTAAIGFISLNDPLSARLVPAQLRRLRESAVALMLVLAVIGGGLLGLVFGHPLAFIMGSAGAMLGFSATLRWPALWFFAWVLPFVFFPSLRDLPVTIALVALARDGYRHQPLTQTGVVLLAAGASLWRLFQNGGAAHARSWRRARWWRHATSLQSGGGMACVAGAQGRWAPLARLFQWGHPLWREHLLRSARPTASSVCARADFAALRGLHWSASGSTSILVFGAFLIGEMGLLVFAPEHAERVIRGAIPGLSMGLMSSMMAPLFGLAATLHRTRSDQALLTLVPGMPRGPAMNRWLAFRLLRQYLGMWGLAVGAILVMGALAPGEASAVDARMLGLHAAAVALPTGLLLWRDWSRQLPASGTRVGALTMAMLVLMGLSGAASGYWGFSPLWTLAAAAVMTLALGVWRWQAIGRLAPFWPVGRHGGEDAAGRGEPYSP